MMQRMTSLDHMRALCQTIGPRGSTSEEEAKASDYVFDQVAALGYTPHRQMFMSALSAYAPYALFAALLLLSIVLFWQMQPVGAAAAFILTAMALVSVVLELQFKSNPLRWLLPVEQSQNVYTRIPAQLATEPAVGGTQTLVITAHVDTHRTPLVFRSPFWLQVFGVLMPAGIISAVLLLAMFAAGIVVPALLLRQIALLPGVVMLLILALMLQADRTPYSPGADDNASGVATVLALAERLKDAPLQRTDVVAVFTGCEEVGDYGADAFLRAKRTVLGPGPVMHMVIDQVAGAGTDPCVVRGERFLVAAPSDPALLTLAERVIAAHPELNATMLSLSTAYGELSVGVKNGYRAIAIGSLRKDGASPNWHKPSDTMDNIDESALARSQELAWHLLQAIDGARG
jgi:hypothetical protein